MYKVHFDPEAPSSTTTLVYEVPLHRSAGTGYGNLAATANRDLVDCKICLRKMEA